jgi:hypothetical protein
MLPPLIVVGLCNAGVTQIKNTDPVAGIAICSSVTLPASAGSDLS